MGIEKQERLFVIPLAGEGSRFPIDVWQLPKPLITFNNKTFVEYSIKSLPVRVTDRIIFVVREGKFTQRLISTILAICGNIPISIVTVSDLTRGQADSVRIGLQNESLGKPLWIHNGDSALNCDWSLLNSRSDGALITFTSNLPRWSFAKSDKFGKVLRVEEKVPISTSASTGTYIFEKASDFIESLEDSERNQIRGELYVAPLYNYLIDIGREYYDVKCEHFFCLGTPEDFESSKEGLLNDWIPQW